jgi:NTP pyrophosphatase (non-canonical NTP hydrolase)
MDGKEYVKNVMVTAAGDHASIGKRLQVPSAIDLLHGAMGMATEAGELLDAVKKHIFYGRTLDTINIEEELGDSMWYFGLIIHALHLMGYETGIEVICEKNILKLRARYGAKFSEAAANERDLAKEREILESTAPSGQKLAEVIEYPINNEPGPGEIKFMNGDSTEFMRFENNGDIYVKGNLVDNDVEVLRAFREYMLVSGRVLTMENAKGVFSKFSDKERYKLMKVISQLGIEIDGEDS